MAAQRFFDNSTLRVHPKNELVKANIAEQFGMATSQLTEEALKEAIQKGDISTFDEDAICRFYADVQKSVDAEEDKEKKEQMLEKAHKDLGKLIRTTVIDKNGHKRTVYIARKEYKSHTEHHAEIHATIARQRSLLANPKSPQSARNRAHEIIKTEEAKLEKLTAGTKKESGEFKPAWKKVGSLESPGKDLHYHEHSDGIGFKHDRDLGHLSMITGEGKDEEEHHYHKPVKTEKEANDIIGRTLDGGAEDREWEKRDPDTGEVLTEEMQEHDAKQKENIKGRSGERKGLRSEEGESEYEKLSNHARKLTHSAHTSEEHKKASEAHASVVEKLDSNKSPLLKEYHQKKADHHWDMHVAAKKEEAKGDKHEVKTEKYTWGNKLSVHKDNKEVGILGHTDGKGPDHISQMQELKAGETMTFNDSNDQKVKITAKDGKGNYSFQRLNLRGEPTTEPGGSFHYASGIEGPKGKQSGGARTKKDEGNKKVDEAIGKLRGTEEKKHTSSDPTWAVNRKPGDKVKLYEGDVLLQGMRPGVYTIKSVSEKPGTEGKHLVFAIEGQDGKEHKYEASYDKWLTKQGEDKKVDAAFDKLAGEKKETKKLPKSNVSVEGEAHYEFANGKPPRGQGSWIFGLGIKDIDWNKHKKDEDYIQTPVMSYSDAKKLALEVAAKKGKPFIHIMS